MRLSVLFCTSHLKEILVYRKTIHIIAKCLVFIILGKQAELTIRKIGNAIQLRSQPAENHNTCKICSSFFRIVRFVSSLWIRVSSSNLLLPWMLNTFIHIVIGSWDSVSGLGASLESLLKIIRRYTVNAVPKAPFCPKGFNFLNWEHGKKWTRNSRMDLKILLRKEAMSSLRNLEVFLCISSCCWSWTTSTRSFLYQFFDYNRIYSSKFFRMFLIIFLVSSYMRNSS